MAHRRFIQAISVPMRFCWMALISFSSQAWEWAVHFTCVPNYRIRREGTLISCIIVKPWLIQFTDSYRSSLHDMDTGSCSLA